jgi:hypothetical protein
MDAVPVMQNRDVSSGRILGVAGSVKTKTRKRDIRVWLLQARQDALKRAQNAIQLIAAERWRKLWTTSEI